MQRCCDQQFGSMGPLKGGLRLSFSDRTIKLIHNAQFAGHAYIKAGLIGQWFGFKASWLISKGLWWRRIGRPVDNYCLHVIYFLFSPRRCIKRLRAAAAVLWRFEPPKHFNKHVPRPQMPAPAHSTATSCCQCIPPRPHSYPSHLPPFPNLYVNSRFLKQCNMHIYPLVAGAQKPRNKWPEPSHGKQPCESLQFW